MTNELRAQLESNKASQRHGTHAELVYWHDQWRLLAERAVAALDAQAGGWLPIESAPRSGEVVLFHIPGQRLPEMCRADDHANGLPCLDNATHWQPLPAGPVEGGEGG